MGPDPVFTGSVTSVNVDMVVFRAGLILDAQHLASWRLNFQEHDFFL